MIIPASRFLRTNRITLRDVARKSKISLSMLSSNLSRPLSSWWFSVIQALAKSTGSTSAQVIDDLESNSWTLQTNDKSQIIQGVYISNPAVYQKLKFVVMDECFEGWQPTRADILKLYYSTSHPNKLIQKVMKSYHEASQKWVIRT